MASRRRRSTCSTAHGLEVRFVPDLVDRRRPSRGLTVGWGPHGARVTWTSRVHRGDRFGTVAEETRNRDRRFECHRRAGYLLSLPRVLSEHSHELAFEVTFELRVCSAYASITTPASLLSWATAPRRRAARSASSGSAARAMHDRAPARYDECEAVAASASSSISENAARASTRLPQAKRREPKSLQRLHLVVLACGAAELRQHSRVGDTGGLVVVLDEVDCRRGRRDRWSPRPRARSGEPRARTARGARAPRRCA